MHGAARERSELHDAGLAGNLGTCLTEEQVLGFVGGWLGREEIWLVDAHMRQCGSCAALAIETLHMGHERPVARLSPKVRCVAFEPGTRVADRYIIRRFIGQGGMSDVYEAFDQQLEQPVALKMARATECDDPESTSRLSAEVKLARRVSHPNICRVHDLGVHQDARPHDARISFITMELIEGESLARCLASGPLCLERLRAVSQELLVGVSAIHRAGLIHRDIKSHNVMLRRIAQPKSVSIIDFGLAIDGERASVMSRASERLSPFSLEGSPAYMAPEQFDAIITPASDVFACGVVFFEALTGRLPFRFLGPERKAGARRDPREVPLRATALAPDVPPSLDAFIAKCLDLDPVHRFGDAVQALDSLTRTLPYML